MIRELSHTEAKYALTICELGLKNQRLLSGCLDHGLFYEAKRLQQIDRELSWLLLQVKRLGNSTHYIWRTQDDVKVRPSHAANDDRIFSWDKPPATGHPGEDYNCRCWAEPIGDNQYANQFLITTINDNPDKWTNADFSWHYVFGDGVAVTLQETGRLDDIITYFSETLGKYDDVNEQIIQSAINNGEGTVPYSFNNTYNFKPLLFILGGSTVKGVFDGDARIEKENGQEYLVINGVMSYTFSDRFTDPTSKVDDLMEEEGITREEAIARLGDSVDEYGTAYDILDQWRTKFNATVNITGR